MAGDNRVRFYTDENMPESLAVQAARHGIDVLRCQAVGLMGAGDEVHLEYAARAGRAVLTRDYDFVGLHYEWLAQEKAHAGIVFIDEAMSVGNILWVVRLFWKASTVDEMNNQLVFAKEFIERR